MAENAEPGSGCRGALTGGVGPSCAFRGHSRRSPLPFSGGGFHGAGRCDPLEWRLSRWVVLLPSEHRTLGCLCPRGAGQAGAASLVGGTDSDPGKPLGLSQNRKDSIAVPGPARP